MNTFDLDSSDYLSDAQKHEIRRLVSAFGLELEDVPFRFVGPETMCRGRYLLEYKRGGYELDQSIAKAVDEECRLICSIPGDPLYAYYRKVYFTPENIVLTLDFDEGKLVRVVYFADKNCVEQAAFGSEHIIGLLTAVGTHVLEEENVLGF